MTEELKKKMEELHHDWAKSAAKNNLNEVLGETSLRSLGRVPFEEGFTAAVELLKSESPYPKYLARAMEEIDELKNQHELNCMKLVKERDEWKFWAEKLASYAVCFNAGHCNDKGVPKKYKCKTCLTLKDFETFRKGKGE